MCSCEESVTTFHRGRSWNAQCSDSTLPSELSETYPTKKSRNRKAKKKRTRRRRVKVRDGPAVEAGGCGKGQRQQTQEIVANRGMRSDKRKPTHNAGSKSTVRNVLTENIPYVKDMDDDFEGESLVYYFMTKSGSEPRRVDQAEFVASFCPESTLEDLQSLSPNLPSRNICLIDDRTNDGSNSVSLGYDGPLTVRKLYLKLKEKRFHAEEDPSLEQSKTSVVFSSEVSSLPLNADRRLIFTTDLDKYGITALMATASHSQVNALGETLYKHIAFKPHITASIETRGFPIFSLSFHLPFYAWRSTHPQNQPRDTRLNRDGNPIRKVFDMSFLRGATAFQTTLNKFDYLCEAQISVLIIGIDKCRWTGFCFVDNYFESQERRECVDRYHTDAEGGIQTDPFTEGECEANCPILNPWEYFLAVLDCRAKLFKDEWQRSANIFQHRIEAYIDGCRFMSTPSLSLPSAKLRQSLSWVGRTRQQLRKLIQCLKATIRHWDCFEHKEQFRTPAGCQYISSIQDTFTVIGHCADQLESLCKICDDYAKHLALYMNDEGNRDTKLQAKLAEYSQTITYFLLYFIYPTTLAAGLLSMQEKAIPGLLGPNKLSFVILATVLTILVFILVTFMHHWRSIQAFIRNLLEKERIKDHMWDFGDPGDYDEDIELGGGPY